MILYKPVTLEDKELMDAYFSMLTIPICDFSFATIFCWRHKFMPEYAIINDFLVIRYYNEGKPAYMIPIGSGDARSVISAMLEDAELRGEAFRIEAATEKLFKPIQQLFPDKFRFDEDRDAFEYVYKTRNLVNLTGKHFQSKRNHINRFKSLYPDYSHRTITEALIPQCMELYDKWCADHLLYYPDMNLEEDRRSVLEAFEHFTAFGLLGVALFVGEEIIAFSYGEKIADKAFVVHSEKALADYHGAFSMINQLSAKLLTEASGCAFVNREEDMGIESLRKAKMQYRPCGFLRKGTITLI